MTRHELAQAIRRGREMTDLPQIRGFDIMAGPGHRARRGDIATGACAIGFAAIGMGIVVLKDDRMVAAEPTVGAALGRSNVGFPEETIFWPCCYSGRTGYISRIVAHLNDDHEWTIDQITDWLDGGLKVSNESPQEAEALTV